ncbi:MAG: hypothetical protein PWR13_475 [Archaeoglobi archaeon]|nr:hypothetical protein [Archaeoglobi archaeon]
MSEKTNWFSVLLIVISAFVGTASGMLYAATMPLQAAELGAPEWVVTMIPMGLPAIVAVILLLPVGAYADSSGRRKELLIASLFLTLIADVGLYYTNSWQALVLLRILTGLPFAFFSLYAVLLAFILPEEKRGTAMALGIGSAMFGMGVFQAISGMLVSMYGHKGLYLIGAGLALLAIIFLLPVKAPAVKLPAGISGKDLASVVKNRNILYTGILFIFYLTGWQMMYGSFPTVMVNILGAPVEVQTVLFAVASVMLGFGTFIWGPVIDKIGTKKTIFIGLGTSTVATFLIVTFASSSLWGYVILFWLATFGGVCGAPGATTIATKSVQPELATLAVNMMFVFINLPAIIGGMASGMLIAAIGLMGMLLAAAVLQLIGTLMAAGLPKV